MRKLFVIIILFLVCLALFIFRININDFYIEETVPPVPIAVNYQDSSGIMDPQIQDELPREYNLAVPFMVQAPAANWDLPYQEACEEAAIIMLHYYIQNKDLNSELANQEILDLVDWQNDYFGDYKDTTIMETAEIMREYWGYNLEVINNPTITIIKEQVVAGHPVIAPFYGRALGNPYYSGEGPLYHMMVIKGYIEDKFITNDPGTKRGKDYLYSYDIIMSAMHDWNGGDVVGGLPSIIVIR